MHYPRYFLGLFDLVNISRFIISKQLYPGDGGIRHVPAQNFNGVVARAESLNKENPLVQYHAAWSNECIEFWFMLHFAYYTSNNHRAEYPNRWEKTESINNQAWIHVNMLGPSLIAFLNACDADKMSGDCFLLVGMSCLCGKNLRG